MRAARLDITASSRPRLPRHVHLRFDALREKPIVLAPERVLWPDEISTAILTRCDGQTTVCEMAEDFARDYAAPPAEIEADIIAFLQDWADRLLIEVATGENGAGTQT
ncbi:pyrroloquinoline quinone biosynthesis peptide chaperone PqqD [Breoghania sp.]|uniref:pyrroloquinoline quinone biosynthesis peptide chaperone PqqD n=1 Tax=Breoghania sp. TaxID=2065378 RepID=UPI002AAB0F2E|nr:pyrroloquinoline quinone biosynthesis peptide chaperone PqqD [Breoghania sp.]